MPLKGKGKVRGVRWLLYLRLRRPNANGQSTAIPTMTSESVLMVSGAGIGVSVIVNFIAPSVLSLFVYPYFIQVPPCPSPQTPPPQIQFPSNSSALLALGALALRVRAQPYVAAAGGISSLQSRAAETTRTAPRYEWTLGWKFSPWFCFEALVFTAGSRGGDRLPSAPKAVSAILFGAPTAGSAIEFASIPGGPPLDPDFFVPTALARTVRGSTAGPVFSWPVTPRLRIFSRQQLARTAVDERGDLTYDRRGYPPVASKTITLNDWGYEGGLGLAWSLHASNGGRSSRMARHRHEECPHGQPPRQRACRVRPHRAPTDDASQCRRRRRSDRPAPANVRPSWPCAKHAHLETYSVGGARSLHVSIWHRQQHPRAHLSLSRFSFSLESRDGGGHSD
ncbi:MAG: hypothetical protein RL077_1552 [Verrucomicrobiota bacterium]